MSADPDDLFTLDMIAPAAPRAEMSETRKPRPRSPTPSRRQAYRSRLASWASWSRAPSRARGGANPSSYPRRAAEAARPRDSTLVRLAPNIGLANVLGEIDPAEISAEASSESRRAPTYDELWREPRRLAASISVAPAPKDRLPGWAAVVAILMGVSALIALREKIVDVAPPAAKVFAAIGLPVNLAGLELREVRSHIEMDGARKVLAVEGEIANMRRDSRSVPPVALTVRGEDGQAKYAWTTRAAKSRLEPGETIAFRARLASPPESGADVLVRFSSLEEAAGRPAVAAR